MLSRTVEQAIRLTTNEGDLLTVGETEAVTQLAAMTFVNRVLPLTLTLKRHSGVPHPSALYAQGWGF
jgi:hypothetical protein